MQFWSIFQRMGCKMNVILVLNKNRTEAVRIAVKLRTKVLRKKVITLLEEDKGREAFELLLARAEVTDFLPPGRKPSEKPEIILMEDLL